MKLIGSITSPYVRRIRILLHNQDYDFDQKKVFDEHDRIKLQRQTPILKVPLLIDKGEVIWDSMLITEHLLDTSFSIGERKILTLLNEASDAGIIAFQLRMFDVDKNLESTLAKNQISRIDRILGFFDKRCEQDSSSWETEQIWLFCFLDWCKFREMFDFTKYQSLVDFYESNQEREVVTATNPRES